MCIEQVIIEIQMNINNIKKTLEQKENSTHITHKTLHTTTQKYALAHAKKYNLSILEKALIIQTIDYFQYITDYRELYNLQLITTNKQKGLPKGDPQDWDYVYYISYLQSQITNLENTIKILSQKIPEELNLKSLQKITQPIIY